MIMKERMSKGRGNGSTRGSRAQQKSPDVQELHQVTPSIHLCCFCSQRWQGEISDSQVKVIYLLSPVHNPGLALLLNLVKMSFFLGEGPSSFEDVWGTDVSRCVAVSPKFSSVPCNCGPVPTCFMQN